MAYLVLARKYRPQNFEQVVKQEHVTRTLINAISSDRVAHAILFSGPRGTGKTTVARLLAKAMNCIKGPAAVPCNKCRSCREITSGSSADVFEIDGASNNSVDQVRELRENLRYMPAHSRYKIYIIDEVHMLSIAAFNALLKTLEEPPSHVMFIFATTEPRKIPITILSRCQRHDFRRIDIDSIAKHMASLCIKEGIDIDEASLGLIAREAGGCMRDALSLLDQAIASVEGPLTYERILDVLGVIDRNIIFDISQNVLRGNIPGILDIFDDIYDRGHDIKKLFSDIVEHFRNLLVVKMGENVDKLVDVSAHEIQQMREQVKNISETWLSQILDLLFKEEETVRFSSQPKLALEMAFIRILQVKPALSIELLIEKIDALKKGFSGIPKVDENNINPSVFHKAKYKLRESLPVEQKETADHFSSERHPIESPPATTISTPDKSLDNIWKNLLSIFETNHLSLASNLSNSVLKKITDQEVEIEVRGSNFNINMIKSPKNMSILKKVCSDFLGKELEIIINTKTIRSNEDQHKNKQFGRLKQEALSHPLVADAMEIFNGTVVDVKIL